MKRHVLLCSVAMAAAALIACDLGAPDTRDADAKALRDNETQWNQDFAAKDAAKLTEHYADDAVLMVTGMPASSGKEAIRKTLTEMVADPALAVKFAPSHVEVAKSGDVAFTQGSYTLTMTDPNSKQAVNDHGSYVTTYRKQPGGSWKAVSDIVTSEVPPPAPAPEPKKK
jgi:uncharacterized protein (TIGR02246 family)